MRSACPSRNGEVKTVPNSHVLHYKSPREWWRHFDPWRSYRVQEHSGRIAVPHHKPSRNPSSRKQDLPIPTCTVKCSQDGWKLIIRYIQGTMPHGLMIKPFVSNTLSAYSDSIGRRVLMTGDQLGIYDMLFDCNLIAWSAKKQATVSRSSTKSE